MPFKTLRLAGAALIAAATLAPTAVSAQYYGAPAPYYGGNPYRDGYGYDRDGYDRTGYGYDRDQRRPPPNRG